MERETIEATAAGTPALANSDERVRALATEVLAELPYEPNEDQLLLVVALCHFLCHSPSRGVFLLGGFAGTGKTSLTGAIVRALTRRHISCVLMAPTGRAAHVLSLHSGHPAWTGTYGSNNSVTINGGKVEAIARGYGAGIGGGGTDDSDPTVRAGSGGVIVINGGDVDASSEYGYGIGPGRIHDFSERDGEPGSITLGWRNPTDVINMSSVYGNLAINNDFAIEGYYVKAVPENVNEQYYLTLLPANLIEIEEGIENGSVEMDYNACPIGEAKQFSVYVYPDQDYVLAEIKAYIKDAGNAQGSIAHFAPSGNQEVPLTKVREHEYTFDMPNGSVMIEASFEEYTPTGIVDIDAAALKSGQRYNLLGQPVDQHYKGVVIVDGTKLIIK